MQVFSSAKHQFVSEPDEETDVKNIDNKFIILLNIMYKQLLFHILNIWNVYYIYKTKNNMWIDSFKHKAVYVPNQRATTGGAIVLHRKKLRSKELSEEKNVESHDSVLVENHYRVQNIPSTDDGDEVDAEYRRHWIEQDLRVMQDRQCWNIKSKFAVR